MYLSYLLGFSSCTFCHFIRNFLHKSKSQSHKAMLHDTRPRFTKRWTPGSHVKLQHKKSRHSAHSTIFAVVAVKVSYTDGRKDLPTAAAKCNAVHQAKSFISVACWSYFVLLGKHEYQLPLKKSSSCHCWLYQ